jgi:hypothetical protein
MEDRNSQIYNILNKEWKSTCRLVFGSEIGELAEYRDWLVELNDKRFVKKSSLSGIETVFANNGIGDDVKYICMSELDFNKKFEPLSINEIKDIDSIISALEERFYYCGNIVLGNSKFVEKSSNVSDSFFVYDSVRISDCKNIAYSQYLRLCENIFGTNEGGESKFCIRCSILFRNMRSFELWKSTNCSDCYYSYGLESCKEALFSFNLAGRGYAIGNLVLEKDKYTAIKKKLLAEMVETLIKEKRLPSLVDLTSNISPNYAEVAAVLDRQKCNTVSDQHNSEVADQVIQAAFSKTSALIFGKLLEGRMQDYEKWLSTHIVVPYSVQSVLSKKTAQMSNWPGLAQLPKNRLVTSADASDIAEKISISKQDAESFCLANIGQIIGKIAYYTPEERTGENINLTECQWGSSASNCYKSVICVYSKNCAYCSWPRSSEYCFGCGIAFDCGFSMKCYDSVKLIRCFEVDGGRNSSDTYFSHNVEGLQQAMFCFNVKNKHYAIGNAEVGKELFLEVKNMVQDWLLEELGKRKSIGRSVYTL